ncbi:MAG: helix-turn-helix transcriptional regulator [Clostridia bacterium]|nr:helix-turn-helix transcriptional regulator [Clostridia bacterium]
MDKKFVQNRYATIRLAHNVSARKLSLELGQSTEYINQIENGKNMPSLEGLFNFCEYFGVTLGEFFEQEYAYPIEYKKLIQELNKFDALELKQILDLVTLINSKRQ